MVHLNIQCNVRNCVILGSLRKQLPTLSYGNPNLLWHWDRAQSCQGTRSCYIGWAPGRPGLGGEQSASWAPHWGCFHSVWEPEATWTARRRKDNLWNVSLFPAIIWQISHRWRKAHHIIYCSSPSPPSHPTPRVCVFWLSLSFLTRFSFHTFFHVKPQVIVFFMLIIIIIIFVVNNHASRIYYSWAYKGSKNNAQEI